MFSWWCKRKERQQQVVRDADNLMALFGDGAYSEALARAWHEDETGCDPSHWFAVCKRRRDNPSLERPGASWLAPEQKSGSG